jgi:hypothetical protein
MNDHSTKTVAKGLQRGSLLILSVLLKRQLSKPNIYEAFEAFINGTYHQNAKSR